MKRVGRKQAAENVLRRIAEQIGPRLSDRSGIVDKAYCHYIYGLVLQGQGNEAQARKHLASANRLGVRWANLAAFAMEWGFN